MRSMCAITKLSPKSNFRNKNISTASKSSALPLLFRT
uniref:Uncharacterized protein n=1 Tax=Arundo donax TaxID=35708 RepID=A0A0A9C5Z3_ARUDO